MSSTIDQKKIEEIALAFEKRFLSRASLEAAIGKKLEDLTEDNLIDLRQVYKRFLQGLPIIEAAFPFFAKSQLPRGFNDMF